MFTETSQPSSMSSSSKVKAKIYPGAVVCQEAEIKGDVTIGTKTVIHPKAKIFAEHGPIVIGENNLIEEQTLIWNTHPGKTMKIGNQNVFEIGSRCQALYIGDNNILECKARVGPNVNLSDGCVVGAMCELESNETLPANTVIYGTKSQRRQASERPLPQNLQLDFLTKVLPNYHHLKKPMKQSAP